MQRTSRNIARKSRRNRGKKNNNNNSVDFASLQNYQKGVKQTPEDQWSINGKRSLSGAASLSPVDRIKSSSVFVSHEFNFIDF